jgi:competence protein ComEC
LAATRSRAGRDISAVALSGLVSLLERLRARVRAEAGAGRLLPWVPIGFCAGIALYFTASHQPVLSASGAVAAALAVAAYLLRRSRFL